MERVLGLADEESARLGDEVLDSDPARQASANERYSRAYDSARLRTIEFLRETARDDIFRRALIWQNRRVLQTGVASLLRASRSSPTQRDRQNCELVASYLQRYCTKNDTIGFFGPVGWARLDGAAEPISVVAHQPPVVARKVGFEVWCMDLLARVLLDSGTHQPWVPPRRAPTLYVHGNTVQFPAGPPVWLSEPEVRVLAVCDGAATAAEIARELRSTYPKIFVSEVVVYLILEGLRKRNIVSWAADLPVDARPEQKLRLILARIPDERARQFCLGSLEKLERARDAVAEASEDAARLDNAMSALEETFGQLTGHAPRSSGEHAGRALVYEDCVRNVQLELGKAFLEQLSPALEMVFASARWLTGRATQMFRETFRRLYDELKSGAGLVEFARFWERFQPMLFAEREAMAATLQGEFQSKWARVIGSLWAGRRVTMLATAVAAMVREEFGSEGGGWAGSRYQSLDLMLGAANVEAIRRGEYEPVIGELHVGVNTMALSLFVEQHPRPEELFGFTDRDLPRSRVSILFPKWLGRVARTKQVLFTPRDYFLQVAEEAHGADPRRTLMSGSLVVEDGEQGLQARCRERGLRLDLAEVFGDIIMGTVANCFRIGPAASHVPRIRIDRLVVQRETWRFAARDLAFADQAAGASRFLGVRRWRREIGMPRFVFFKSPVEKKPVYLDFDSPILVDIFAKIVRRTVRENTPEPAIVIAEMLPAPSETWLPDAEGRTYTSEFRMIGIDTGAI